MSWLTEWWHKLFPNNKPPAEPQNMRVKTLVADAVAVVGEDGKGNGRVYLASDEQGAYILLDDGPGLPALVIKRMPNGRVRLNCLGADNKSHLMLDMTVNGKPSITFSDAVGDVILDANTIRGLMAK